MLHAYFRYGASAIALIVILVLAAVAIGRISTAPDTTIEAAMPGLGSGPLDGMVFVGRIGPEGNRDLDDELHFSDGQFWSTNCIRCGFRPGAYWVRTVGDRTRFQGKLFSADRGTFLYSGHVSGDRVEATISWTMRRWYWSIDRTLSFAGTLAPARTAAAAGVAGQQAAAAGTERFQCNRL